jgi:Zn-finger nucleic acid-binding protein
MTVSTDSPAVDIDFCPHCGEAWVKKAGYRKCWKCSKSPPSTILTTSREPDDTGDAPIDLAKAAAKAVEEGHFWMAFNEVAKSELVGF